MTATLIQYIPSEIIKTIDIIDIFDLIHITGGHETPARSTPFDVHIFGWLIESPRV
jgi:hypothetical protein